MNTQDVLVHPRWRPEELGRPIPDSIHAVSMALPCWEHVIGYEEKRPEVVAKLTTGYPRFVIHPLVQELARKLAGERPCLPFASSRAAEQCVAFIHKECRQPADVVSWNGCFGTATTDTGSAALRSFWQHAGMIVTSRQAQALLSGPHSADHHDPIRHSLRRQIAGLYDCADNDVFLTPTGMAAHFAALQVVTQRCPGRPTAQLGFPYVDTLKLQQKLGAGALLLHDLANIEDELHHVLEPGRLAACFCEIPGNPLLGSADLRRIAPILRASGVPLVADDVVATPVNVDLGAHADLIVTSLTKFIAGTGDVMGGALICNPKSPLYPQLKAIAQHSIDQLLWGDDAAVLDRQARSFPERMQRHNANGLLIAERLRAHPAVERVWYPKWEFSEVYEAVRRPRGGWGSLLTFLPRHAETRAPAIYDRMAVCKGPSLGTSFTLACPFTLLAHYTELDWAESCGVSRHLIRISVGLEDPEELWRRLDQALAV